MTRRPRLARRAGAGIGVLTVVLAVVVGAVGGPAASAPMADAAAAVAGRLSVVVPAPGLGAVVDRVPGLVADPAGYNGALVPTLTYLLWDGSDVDSAFYAGRVRGWTRAFVVPARGGALLQLLVFRAVDPAQAAYLVARWAQTVGRRGGAVRRRDIGFPVESAIGDAIDRSTPSEGIGFRKGSWAVIIVRRPLGGPDTDLVRAARVEAAHLGAGGTSLDPVEGRPLLHLVGWVLLVVAVAAASALLVARRRVASARRFDRRTEGLVATAAGPPEAAAPSASASASDRGRPPATTAPAADAAGVPVAGVPVAVGPVAGVPVVGAARPKAASAQEGRPASAPEGRPAASRPAQGRLVAGVALAGVALVVVTFVRRRRRDRQ